MKSKLTGREVDIPAYDGKYYGDWGIVIDFDGDYYHIAFAGDLNNVMVFTRREIKVKRK